MTNQSSSTPKALIYRAIAVWLIAILLTILIERPANAAVGRTPGTAEVTQSGAFSYHIPIWVPPGVRGLQPNLSLDYNSSAGDGMLGVGWSLNGLSSISVCKPTVAQDGFAAPVILSTINSSPVCLDGNRLRFAESGDGSAQTEMADFSYIMANGPYFTALSRDRMTYQYGAFNGDNAIVLAKGTSIPLEWKLDQIIDPDGNTMRISYQPANQNSNLEGTTVPASILWLPTSHGASTYIYSMQFNYQILAVPHTATYVAGTPVQNAYLLKNIYIKYEGSTVKNYVLTYSNSTTTSRYLLSSVTECADDAATNCLAPTVIETQSGAAGIASSYEVINSAINTATGGTVTYTQFDFNGDGRSDLAWGVLSGNTVTLWVAFANSTGTGFSTPINTGLNMGPGILGLPPAGNVDGSGVDGFLVPTPDGTWWLYKWNGNAFTGTSTGAKVDYAGGLGTFLADVDGDGLDDIVSIRIQTDNYLYVRLNTSVDGIISFAANDVKTVQRKCTVSPPLICPLMPFEGTFVRKIDTFGDGQADILEEVPIGTDPPFTGYTTWLYHFVGGTFVVYQLPTGQKPYLFADFNGDGCMDLVAGSVIALSGCDGTFPAIWQIPTGQTALSATIAMDWNGDGRPDLVVDNGGQLGVFLSTGSGLSSLQPTGSSVADHSGYIPFIFPVHNALGDGSDSLVYDDGLFVYYANNGFNRQPDLVTSITDGYGVNYNPTYTSIANGSYTKGSGAIYPEQDWIGPRYVVSRLSGSDGIGGAYTRNYSYIGARVNLQGRGFEGYQSITVTDSRAGSTVRKTQFQTAFPQSGMTIEDDVFQADGITPISKTTNTNSVNTLDSTSYNQAYFPYVTNSTSQYFEVGGSKNGQLISTIATGYAFDNYGNATTIATTTTDKDGYSGQTWTTTTTNTPGVDTVNWCLSLFTQTQVVYTASNAAPVTRIQQFTPDTVNCRYTQVITAPASATYQVTEAFGFDTFGNVNSDTVTGIGMTPRQTRANWGTTGQFPMSVTDPSGATTQLNYNLSYGLPSSVTDANEVTTSWLYEDGFGRKTQENRPDGTYTTWSYSLCSGCDPNSRLVVSEQPRDTIGHVITNTTSYFDMLDRPLYELDTLLDGTTSWTMARGFDSLGRLQSEAFPFRNGGPSIGSVTYTHDPISRVTLIQRPTSASNSAPLSTVISYQGDTVVTTDPQGKQATTITTAAGMVEETIDHNGYYISFGYDAFGSLTRVTDSSSNTLFSASYAYGLEAFQLTRIDMDAGTSTYTYDALGELTAWTSPSVSAKGATSGSSFRMWYDALSRPIEKQISDNLDYDTIDDVWSWGSTPAAHNVGLLTSESRSDYDHYCGDGDPSLAQSYFDSYGYDDLGRLAQRTLWADDWVDGYCGGTYPPPQPPSYAYTWTYNANTGLIDSLTYPVSTSSYALQLHYNYQYGILQSITAVSDSPNVVVWRANAVNAAGQIVEEGLGNGVVVDRNIDSVTNWLSTMQAGPSVNGVRQNAAVQNQSYLYDLVGNVTQRQNNNLGLNENLYYDNLYRLDHSSLNGVTNLQMNYDAMGNITSRSDVANGAAWTYDPSKTHQVTAAGSNTYAYSDAGTVISRNGFSVYWTLDGNLAATFPASGGLSNNYGPNGSRLATSYYDSTRSEYIGYVGDAMELATLSPNYFPDYRHYVYVAGRAVAVLSRRVNGNAWHYFVGDQEGSVASVTDATGATTANESFAAFGTRRNASTWSGPPTSTDISTMDSVTAQGYNFQTALESLELTHMNGRVQDSVIGLFLSPDPYIPDVANTLDFNRYSYVDNNPLTYTDPSGFDGDEITYYTISVNISINDGTFFNSPGDPLVGTILDDGSVWGGTVYLDPQAGFYSIGGDDHIGGGGNILIHGTAENLGNITSGGGKITIVSGGMSGGTKISNASPTFTPGLVILPAVSATSARSGWNLVHAGLTAGSFLPSLLGAGAAALDSAAYAMQGKWTDAGLSITSAGIGVFADAGVTKLGLKAAKAGADALAASRVATSFGGLSRAAQFGVDSYGRLRGTLSGTGLQAHHLIEQRFASVMGQNARAALAVALTPAEHQAFTNAWRSAIPYGAGTANATRQQVTNAARQIYANYPAILRALGL